MKRYLALLFTLLMLAFAATGCAGEDGLSPEHPITLTMWHVYGSQTQSPLHDVIDEFNRTVGAEHGVNISVTSVTDSSSIDAALIAAANGEPGAAELPDLFTAYSRVAEKVGTEKLLDWSGYFSEEELAAFVDDFLAEGYLDGRLLMLPVAKSTELCFLNRTLFDRFADAEGAGVDGLADFDSLFGLCMRYYDWTGGQAMFQINDFYNYFLVNIASLGGAFVADGTLDCGSAGFERVFRPMAEAVIHGGICVEDGYASDRWKTGEIICNIGSTAGMLYLRDDVTYPDNTIEPIEINVLPYPTFREASPAVLQRGTGLFALHSEDERRNEAAALFAKWLTEEQHNLDFVTNAGYLPVTGAAFEQLFADTGMVENEKYRMLYDVVGSMYDSYQFCTLPLYDNSGDIVSGFERTVKSVLAQAHEAYDSRVAGGEDPEAVLTELVDSSLEQIRASVG